jgi:diguanylate cyclase (GGDEF)-like protein
MFASHEKRREISWIAIGVVLVFSVGAIDLLTGSELSLSLFYLIPIAVVTWFSGRRSGLVISIFGAAVWLVADELDGQPYSHPGIRYWNAVIRFGFFAIVTWLLPAIREREFARGLARIDDLTGAANRRSLFEILQSEIDRAQRYKRPLAIAYLDLDNFKIMNDRFGHKIGDDILCTVVNQIEQCLRKTDSIARIGGDEFILVFPEADESALRGLVPRIQIALLEEMQRKDWPVTFSFGALTCLDISMTPDELIKRADALMYSVKEKGKNAIAYGICSD